MTGRTGVTLVIPAWNEAESIGPVLDEVPRDTVDEILVVVGAQDDPTALVARGRGARVLVQILRVHGHGADQEDWTAMIVEPVGHYRTERESWLLSRQGRQTTHPIQVHQRAGTLGEGGLRHRRQVSC